MTQRQWPHRTSRYFNANGAKVHHDAKGAGSMSQPACGLL
jgi:hypothetical protein